MPSWKIQFQFAAGGVPGQARHLGGRARGAGPAARLLRRFPRGRPRDARPPLRAGRRCPRRVRGREEGGERRRLRRHAGPGPGYPRPPCRPGGPALPARPRPGGRVPGHVASAARGGRRARSAGDALDLGGRPEAGHLRLPGIGPRAHDRGHRCGARRSRAGHPLEVVAFQEGPRRARLRALQRGPRAPRLSRRSRSGSRRPSRTRRRWKRSPPSSAGGGSRRRRSGTDGR